MARVRSFGLVLGLLIAGVVVVGCSDSDHSADDRSGQSADDRSGQSADESSGEFYLQLADEGSIELTDGIGTLTLRDASPTLLWMTDRPQRSTGRMSLDSFLDSWEQFGFGEVPPNAFITSHNEDISEEGTIAVELADPTLAQDGTTLTYSITALDDSARSGAESVSDVALFIDSGIPVAPADRTLYMKVWFYSDGFITEADYAMVTFESTCCDTVVDVIGTGRQPYKLGQGVWTATLTSSLFVTTSFEVDLLNNSSQTRDVVVCKVDNPDPCK